MGRLVDRKAMIAHAVEQLDIATKDVDWHQPGQHGLCRCGRPLDCPEAATAAAYAAHWQARIAYYAPALAVA